MRLLKISLLTLALTSFVSISVFAQDSLKCSRIYFQDSLLEKLTGQWNLSGQIGKRPVKNDFSASWVLNHQFLELNFTDLVDPPGYMAKVLIGYDCISDQYVIHWLDILGGRVSKTLGYGTRSGDTIELRFEYPDGPFLNKIKYNRIKGAWQFHMTSKAGDQWVVFGDEYLKRN